MSRNRKFLPKGKLILGVLAAAAAVGLMAPPARTADHRDAPAINSDPTADINDVYAFVAPNGNVVLAMTVNPFTVPGVGASFSNDVLYQFKIDNTGDAREDLVIQATFSKATSQGTGQTFTVRGPSAPRGGLQGAVNLPLQGGPTVTGPADGSVTTGTGAITKVFAGLRDDPFFFDLVYIFRALGIQSGGLPPRNPGVDFFAGMNVSILAVEVNPAALRGSLGTKINFWGTTSRARTTARQPGRDNTDSGQYVQIERMGLPVINTVLIGRAPGTSARKDLYNRSIPSDDRRLFRQEALGVLTSINGDAAYSSGLIDALLPDMLPLDTSSTAGFLNGRRPEDDVIDAVLNLASKGAVTSDGVSANDKAFLGTFPYFAPPHQPEDPIPPRN
jgi:hypothetical protein